MMSNKTSAGAFGLALGMALAFSLLPAGAATVNVPSGSFETPVVPPGFPAYPVFTDWQRTAQPSGVTVPGGLTWDQLSGVFPNTAVGMPDHIANMDGNQAAYLFSFPGVGIYQDLSTTFGVGQSYNLALGVIGGGGGMQQGSSLLLGLYYRDAGNNPVSVGSTLLTYTPAAFPTTTNFLDSQFTIPAVQAGDAWAGRGIGVQVIASAGQFDGYWDIDNLRLQTVPEPGTWAMAGAALGLLGVVRLRRRTSVP